MKIIQAFRLFIFVSTVWVASVPASAASVSLPDAIFTGNFFNAGTTGIASSAGTYSVQGLFTHGSLVISATPMPSLSSLSSVNIPSDESQGATYTGSLTYSFEIVGPTGEIPLIVNASGRVSASALAPGAQGTQYASAIFQVVDLDINHAAGVDAANFTGRFDPNNAVITGTQSTGFLGNFSETGTYSATANHIYNVTLSVSTSAGVSGTFGGGFQEETAFVDPTFTIDPTFSNVSAYSIVLSNGIGNTAIPLPAGIWLLGSAALGVIGFIRRHAN